MQELKKMDQWILWDLEETKDGKQTKVPKAFNGKPTGTSYRYRDTWVPYDMVEKMVEYGLCSGVGFVLPASYFLLDLDHRSMDDPLVKELLSKLRTYAEISVSGHGVHFIGKVNLSRMPYDQSKPKKLSLSPEYYQKNTEIGMELYIGGMTNRYATYSGQAIQDLPIVDCTDAILEILDLYMRRSKTASSDSELLEPNQTEMTEEELDAEVADVIAGLYSQKNAPKFKKLFDNGDRSGYPSESEADMALCNIIAYRAGNNPRVIEEIFNRSALCRDKWENREDYREMTIRKAILLCAGNFHPSAMAHPPFIRFEGRKKKPVLVPALLAQYIRETIPFFLVQNNSKQATMPFVYENGCYRYFDKQMMLGKIKEPVEAYDIELVSMPKITEVYNQLISDRNRVLQKELNADEHLINFENGLLEVTKDELILYPHSPEIKSTIQIPCAWKGEEQETPVFDAYLDTLTSNDPEIKQLLLEYIGMCISNVKGWRPKKALFLVGPGDTGKSVLKALVEWILGEGNYVAIDLQEIEARFGTGVIYGVRLAGSSDMSYITVCELKTFKKLTGGDGIFAEFKGQQGFEYTYTGLLWFCMNRLPRFGGDDGKWVYDRIMIVKCGNVITKENQDRKLLDKLYAEREGIIHKAIRALQTVMANGYRYSEPESVIRAREEYRQENNTAIAFFTECMCERKNPKTDPRHRVSDVYDAYLAYCRKNGYEHHKKSIEFRQAILEHLNITDPEQLAKHCKKGTCYLNYMLTEEAREIYAPFAA